MRFRTPNSVARWVGRQPAVWAAAALLIAGCGVKTQPEDPQNTPDNNLTITELSPANGPETGGQVVEVRGTGLDDGTGAAAVYFGTEAATVNSVSATMIEVVTPVGAVGPINVQVTNAFGSYTLEAGYTYDQVAQTFGAVTILTLYDVINPNQFNPPANDFVDAFASFVAPDANSLLTQLQAADSCQVNPPAPPDGNYTPLNAGAAVQFDLGGLTINLTDCMSHGTPCAPEDMSYYPEQVINDPNLFQFAAAYTVSAPGGAGQNILDAFSTPSAILTPTDFTVSSPDIGFFDQNTGYTTVGASADLTMTWTGGNAGDAFFIVADAYDQNAGDYTGNSLVCRPADDGSFTIPGANINSISGGASHLVLFVARRGQSEWVVPPNASTGESLAIVYKVGVVAVQ